ncbi:hypothetical protein [Mammaliicoccus sciuri]|uniref:hypothetical protein n=1 Tax=Mammaliicoccus sciuri TaxID=1296 RepID=UPI002B25F4B0|nr:hypothetical protein [Mammaliicoccus sciuri]WQK75208.1 hypothetical protein P3U33_05620 [Mammaliicoccus sciuri]
MNKYQLLTTDGELIFESDNTVKFKSYVRNQIIFDIEFKLGNEDYPKDIVKVWQDDITKLLDDNVSYDTVINYANDWEYKIG